MNRNLVLERAGSNPEKLNALRWTLDSQHEEMKHSIGFARGVMRAAAEGRITSGVPKSLKHMSLPGRDLARQELAELGQGNSLWELWALGIQQCAVLHPHVFGAVTDHEAHQERVAELRERLAALLEKIPKAWGPEDGILGALDRENKCLVTLKVAPEVTLAPLSNLGERLIEHLTTVEPPTVSSAPVTSSEAGRKALRNGAAAPL